MVELVEGIFVAQVWSSKTLMLQLKASNLSGTKGGAKVNILKLILA